MVKESEMEREMVENWINYYQRHEATEDNRVSDVFDVLTKVYF